MAGERGRPPGTIQGDFGDFVSPHAGGALVAGVQRVLGPTGPSRRTLYRMIGAGWPATLPTQPGSAGWLDFDRYDDFRPDQPGVTHVSSVAASALACAAQRQVDGYRLRSERAAARVETHTPAVVGAPVVAWVESGAPPPIPGTVIRIF